MKIGDLVKNEKYGLMGTIQDIGPCKQPGGCVKQALTLDPKESGVIGYWHTDDFEVVTSEPIPDVKTS